MVQLLGWISIEITADPVEAPSFAVGGTNVNNDEGGLVPQNALEIQFENNCAGWAPPPSFGVRQVHVFNNYLDTESSPAMPVCQPTAQNKLNHFEISVSQSRVDVSATPVSSDGVHFAAPTPMYGTDVSLPFSRGYVQLTTHNHATLKYTNGMWAGTGGFTNLDAWTARWDNVGFDGPILSNWREYEIPDSLVPGMNGGAAVMSIGYTVADASKGPSQKLTFHGVDLTQVATARLSLSSFYDAGGGMPASGFDLQYRFNGRAWRDRLLTAGEIAFLTGGNSHYTLGQMLDVSVSDLVQGDNTLEFVTKGVPQGYPPMVANIDLVLTTK
jgi:hypothetical protein